jgi:hypothetical protein
MQRDSSRNLDSQLPLKEASEGLRASTALVPVMKKILAAA